MLCLASVLCARISTLKAQEENLKVWEQQCLEYFTEITEIQKFREMLTIGAEVLIKKYERGNLTKKELDSTLSVWHNTESELRHKAMKIYDTAYTEKCFDTATRKEEK